MPKKRQSKLSEIFYLLIGRIAIRANRATSRMSEKLLEKAAFNSTSEKLFYPEEINQSLELKSMQLKERFDFLEEQGELHR